MSGSRHHTLWRSACALVLLGAFGLGGPLEATTAAPAPAADVIAAAVKTAAASHRVVLVEFGASWCTWCRHFQAFVHAPEVASIVANNYVVVNLVVHEREDKVALENPGGAELMDKWGGANSGLPFYVFLDASGRKIADSNVMPGGENIGFPGVEPEVKAFLGLIDKTAPRLSTGDRAKISGYLEASIKTTKS